METDRQTDRASNWKSAIFDVDDNWSKLETLPDFVKTIFKQQEVCPTTQRPHFQVHIVTHRQVRLTQMCSWIKATKWLPVLGKEHISNSIKYCSKSESAVPGTYKEVHGTPYLQIHELLMIVAKQHKESDEETTNNFGGHKDFLYRRSWQFLTSRLVRQDPSWASKLSNPVLEKGWKTWGEEFLVHAKREAAAPIIEGSSSEGQPEEL